MNCHSFPTGCRNRMRFAGSYSADYSRTDRSWRGSGNLSCCSGSGCSCTERWNMDFHCWSTKSPLTSCWTKFHVHFEKEKKN